MLKIRLLITTALIVIGAASFDSARPAEISGAPSAIAAIAATGSESLVPRLDMRTVLRSPGRDRNRDFLCTYGYAVYYNWRAESGSSWIDWQHYAVPITGKGASVTQIIVTDSPGAGASHFDVGIYTDGNGGPDQLLAGGQGKAKGSCTLTTVAIAKTFLAAGTKYWVEEDTERPHRRGTNAVSWGYKPKATHNAVYQDYSATSTSSSISPWLPVSGPAPFVKVR